MIEDFSDDQSRTLELCNVIISVLSIIGSTFIIYCYWSFRDLRTFAFWLVFKTAVSDVFYSIGFFLGDVGGSGENAETHLGASPALCYIQSLLLSYFGLASLFWSVSIAFTLHQAFLLEKEDYMPQNVNQFRVRYMLVCWGVPLLFTLLPFATMSYGDTGGWCWILGSAPKHIAWRFFQFYNFMILAIFYNAYVFRSIEQKMKSLAAEIEGSAKGGGLARRLRLYPMVLVICHSVGFIAAFFEAFGQDRDAFFVLNVLQVIMASSLGWINALVYGLTPEIKTRVVQCGGARPSGENEEQGNIAL